MLRARQFDLDGEEIQTALNLGRVVSKLALEVEGRVALVLGEDMALKSLKFADAVIDEANAQEDGEDPILRLETDFALMAQVLSGVIEQMTAWLGGEAQPAS